MELTPDENSGILKGGFNNNLIVQQPESGKRYLIREPHNENPSLLERIEHEFQSYGGWLDKGNSVRKRSQEEQIAIMSQATRNGLCVVEIALVENNRIVLPFIEGAQTIDEFLPVASIEEAETLVHVLFADLHRAHTEVGIVYGDRWSKNILVKSSERPKPIHVDFDLQYEGPGATDMDVGRMTFYILHAGGKKVIPTLVEALIARGWHDLDGVECIVRGHTEYFHGTPFGNMGDLVDLLFRTLRKTLERCSADGQDAVKALLAMNGHPMNAQLLHEIATLRSIAANLLHSS